MCYGCLNLMNVRVSIALYRTFYFMTRANVTDTPVAKGLI